MGQKKVIEELRYCENCGKPFQRKYYGKSLEDLTRYKNRRFCSLSCANTRKDLTKHGYSWRARKHLKSSCEACGCKVKLQAHHIDQTKENNLPKNIQTLCKHCHDFWHTTCKRIGKYPAGKMVSLVLQQQSPIELIDLKDSVTQ